MKLRSMFRLDPNSKVGRFVGHVVPGVVKPLHILWNEIIGFIFFVLAVWSVPSVIRNWREFGQQGGSPFRLLVSGGFTLIMAYFGVSSFMRARKISRS
jgi:hypothetical protein